MRAPKGKQFCALFWNDAHINNVQVSDKDIIHKPSPMVTFGYLLQSDEVGVSIASEWVPDEDEYRSVTFVPRPMVVEEALVTLAKLRKRVSKSTTPSISSTPSA